MNDNELKSKVKALETSKLSRKKKGFHRGTLIFFTVSILTVTLVPFIGTNVLLGNEQYQISIPESFGDGDGVHGVVSQKKEFFKTNPPLHTKEKEAVPNFVTIVLPSVVNPEGRRKRLDAITQTWGKAAQAVFVVHSQDEFDTEKSKNNTLVYPQTLLIPEKVASVEDGVPRLLYVISTVLQKYKPEFAFFVNDHTYVIPQNLWSYLAKHSPENHLYAGHALKPKDKSFAFNSGAAGYVLSRETLKGLVHKWNEKDPICNPENPPKWLQGNPGLVTAQCLKESMNVSALDTREEGGHVFHAFGIVRTVTGAVDQWYLNKHETLHEIFGEDEKYQHQPQILKKCCSRGTVSFHYVEAAETKALYEIQQIIKLEGPNLSDEKLTEAIMRSWPRDHKDLGGYSRQLPTPTDKEVWNSLLHVMREISS